MDDVIDLIAVLDFEYRDDLILARDFPNRLDRAGLISLDRGHRFLSPYFKELLIGQGFGFGQIGRHHYQHGNLR